MENSKDAWEGTQIKVFINWMNTNLAHVGKQVDQLQDLQTGVLLIELLSILTEKPFPYRYTKNPRNISQINDNCALLFQFLATEKIHLVNIGGKDITDVNIKLILGLIWRLILKYKMKVTQGKSAKQVLLEWVHSKIPEFNIQNFSTAWQDGKAFCALIKVIAGIDLKPGNSSIENLRAALNCAFDNMSIPKIIDPEDIIHTPDELSIMTYVSYFRDYGGEFDLVALLNWVNSIVGTSKIHLTNWSSDWVDGKALFALIEYYSPGLMPVISTIPSTEVATKLNMAFKFAEQRLKISRTLEPQKIVKGEFDSHELANYVILFRSKERITTDPVILEWVNYKLVNKVSNFSIDFQDGSASVEIVKEAFPWMDMEKELQSVTSPTAKWKFAMNIWKEEYGVEFGVDPQLFHENADEYACMNYYGALKDKEAEALLSWFKRVLPNSNVQNFTTDWQDGLKLCSLMGSLCPSSITQDLKKLTPEVRLKTAIEVANKVFGVKQSISVDQFKSKDPSNLPLQKFLRRLRDKELENMLEWVNNKIPHFNIRNFHKDWLDGKALFELCRVCSPDLLSPSLLDNLTSISQLFPHLAAALQIPDLGSESKFSVDILLKISSKLFKSEQSQLLRWVQSKIPERNITNFTTDWEDGSALLYLVHAITGSVDWSQTSAIKSLAAAANFLGIPGLEDLSNISEGTIMKAIGFLREKEKEKILVWVNTLIPEYKIKNFTTDWEDGKALVALISSAFPGLIRKEDFAACKTIQDVLKVLDIPEFKVNHVDEQVILDIIGYYRKKQKTELLDWVNAKIHIKVTDLNKDWENGKTLTHLVESVAYKKFNLSQFEDLTSFEKVLDALNIAELEEIRKVITDNIDDIVLHSIRILKDLEKRKLFQWVQQKLPSSKITNLSSDWENGKNLLDLLEVIDPGKVQPSKPVKNFLEAASLCGLKPLDKFSELFVLISLSKFKDMEKEILLRWSCKRVNQEINDWRSRWDDGKLLQAIIAKVSPGLLESAKFKSFNDPPKVVQFLNIQAPEWEDFENDVVIFVVDHLRKSFNEGLTLWIQRTIPGCKISKFGLEWHNGKVLVDLLNRAVPGKYSQDFFHGCKSLLDISKQLSLVTSSPNGINSELVLELVEYVLEEEKKQCLEWVNSRGVKSTITNFTSDWSDGDSLLTLIDNILPDEYNISKKSDNAQILSHFLDYEFKNGVNEIAMLLGLRALKDKEKNQLINWLSWKIPQHRVANFSKDWTDGKALSDLISRVYCDFSLPKNNPTFLEIVTHFQHFAERPFSENLVFLVLGEIREIEKKNLLNWVRTLLPKSEINSFDKHWSDGKLMGDICSLLFPEFRGCSKLSLIQVIDKLNISEFQQYNKEFDRPTLIQVLFSLYEKEKKKLLSWVSMSVKEVKIDNFSHKWKNGHHLHSLLKILNPHFVDEPYSTFEEVASMMGSNLKISDHKELSVISCVRHLFNLEKSSLLEWVNTRLPHRKIRDVDSSWEDGSLLIELIAEVTSTFPLEHMERNFQTLQQVFNLLEIPNDGFLENSIIVALRHYRQVEENGLREWISKKISVTVTNFDYDWKDGKLLASLVMACIPSDDNISSKDSDKMISEAIHTAHKKLQTPKIPSTVFSKELDRSEIINYLLLLRNGSKAIDQYIIEWLSTKISDCQIKSINSSWSTHNFSSLIDVICPYTKLEDEDEENEEHFEDQVDKDEFQTSIELANELNIPPPVPLEEFQNNESKVMKYLYIVKDKDEELTQSIFTWLKEKLHGKTVSNFVDDWKDGEALAALASALFGKNKDIPKEKKKRLVSGSVIEKVSYAMKLFSKAKVHANFVPEEMISAPQELHIRKYIGTIHYRFRMGKLKLVIIQKKPPDYNDVPGLSPDILVQEGQVRVFAEKVIVVFNDKLMTRPEFYESPKKLPVTVWIDDLIFRSAFFTANEDKTISHITLRNKEPTKTVEKCIQKLFPEVQLPEEWVYQGISKKDITKMEIKVKGKPSRNHLTCQWIQSP